MTVDFINEAFRHCKAIYFGPETDTLKNLTDVALVKHDDPGVISSEDSDADDLFVDAIANHRVWEFEKDRNGMEA